MMLKLNSMDTNPHQTRWSLIARARSGADGDIEAAKAMAELSERYRPVILAAVRRSGVPLDDSEDVCQDFLGQIFLVRAIPLADPAKGRFRTYVLHLLRNSIVDWQRKNSAQKRGQGKVISMDFQDEAIQHQFTDFTLPALELDFEMDFARQLHHQALQQLRSTYTGRGQGEMFDLLTPYILSKQDEGTYATLATATGKSNSTMRQVLSRLRQRYGQLLREQVLETLTDERDLDDELRHVVKLLLASLFSLLRY